MRSVHVASLLVLVGALAGCKAPDPVGPKDTAPPAVPAAKAVGDAGTPAFDFEAYLRREAAPLAVTKLTGAVLSADVEAASAPQVSEGEGSVHVVIPIGTGSNVDCYVYDERQDGAARMSHVIDEVKKSLNVRLFAPTDVFVAGEHAVLVSHAIYLADQGGGKAAGELKLAFYSHPLTSALCMHDEAGYSATFKRVTKRFFETARRSDRELRGKPPTSWEVSVLKLDGRPVGFEDRRTYADPDNRQNTSVSISSTLYPRSAIACRPDDSATNTTVDASGDLLQFVRVVASGQEIELNVDLKRVSPAQYAYSGHQSGKPISGKFKTSDKLGLATTARIAANVKDRLLSGKATSFKAEEYVPSIDPTAPLETLYEIDSKEERRVRVSLGPLKLTAVVDENGDAESVKATVGSSTLTSERLAVGGKR
jgi:hypothetical protein